jgi:hypothetical protein
MFSSAECRTSAKLPAFALSMFYLSSINIRGFVSLAYLGNLKSSILFLLPTLVPLSGVGTTCFSSCCDKDSAIIFTTGRLPDVNPP